MFDISSLSYSGPSEIVLAWQTICLHAETIPEKYAGVSCSASGRDAVIVVEQSAQALPPLDCARPFRRSSAPG